ncbi:MAG: hypothetical protein EPN53_02885 [Acidobacteria bacterium]|nr:MAG: hypothetical protein EPN53_02885 [Acidobacteriota bacterium]
MKVAGPLKRSVGLRFALRIGLAVGLACVCGCRAPERQLGASPVPTANWQAVQVADRITAILFGQLSSLRDTVPALAHLPRRSPEVETACPGPYRWTLLYGVGVDTGLSNPRAWPSARMLPTAILLFVEVRIGRPCIPVPAPTHTIGEVSVQAICYGRDCQPIIETLTKTLAMLKREASCTTPAS